MWFGIVTLFPEMFDAVRDNGVFGRASDTGLLELHCFNPRDYASDKHRTVDDRPYGGGAGMVMMVPPLTDALAAAMAVAPTKPLVVLLSPQGKQFDQDLAISLAASSADTAPQGGDESVRALGADSFLSLILVCGRYEGVDERFIAAHIDEEWSIGDFVLSGGELPAMVVMDAIARHRPGTLGNRMSVIDESFLDGRLDYPQYTRPESVGGIKVPAPLVSGDHKKMTQFRHRTALQRTLERRPDLLTGRLFKREERELLVECLQMHSAGVVE